MNLEQKVLDSLKRKRGLIDAAQWVGVNVDEYKRLKGIAKAKRKLAKLEKTAETVQSTEQFNASRLNKITAYSEDLEKGFAKIEATMSTEPRTAEQIEELLKLDPLKWKLSTFWNKEKPDGSWFISALVSRVHGVEVLTSSFIDFLSTYKPTALQIISPAVDKILPTACLIFNKQDAHLTKYDVAGNNNLADRFAEIETKTANILTRARLCSQIKRTLYILGSDLIDAEWTEATTNFTPQKSVTTYHKGFTAVCDHEVAMINILLKNAKVVEVLFIPGNHDQYVSWHIVNWLKAYYRDEPRLIIDTDPAFTKYYKFQNTAMMFNHGDGMKPEKLAQVFPLDYKDGWSSCDFHCIFTGDKHHELTRDIGGIRFFRVPALSNSKSSWDLKHGWTMVKAELTAYLVTESSGITDIYKEPLGLFKAAA